MQRIRRIEKKPLHQCFLNLPLKFVLLFLLAILSIQQANAAGYLHKQGKGYAICEAFKKRLDALGSLKEPLSSDRLRPFTYEVPGVKSADWQDLDVDTYNELFEKIVRYRISDGPPWKQDNEAENERVSQRFISQWRAEIKSGNAKLQMLRTNLVMLDDSPETVVRIQRKYGPGKYEYTVIMYLMTDDLDAIDVDKLRRTYWMSGAELVAYGDRHYIVSSAFLISSDFGSGLVPFCTIDFDFKTLNREMKK